MIDLQKSTMGVWLAAVSLVAVLTGLGPVSLSGPAIAEECGAGIAKVIRGKTELALADGQRIPANHFRMLSGTEIWLTDPDCGILKMSLKFGPGVGLEFETTELEITTGGL
ncbi:MAG: hypothetical protein P8L66_12505 [Rhodospirillaceae bacterium]|nr:hypothetical protein [Rhodospirillaceae bacterium]